MEMRVLPNNYFGFTVAVDMLDYERMKAKIIREFDINVANLRRESEMRAFQFLFKDRHPTTGEILDYE